MKSMHTKTILWSTLFLFAFGLVSCQESASGTQASKEQQEATKEVIEDESLGVFIVDVNTTHLRFREGPGQDYPVIGKLYKGAKVIGSKIEYEHNQSDWLKVKQEGTKRIGYVHKDYIRPYSMDYYVKLSEEYFPLQVGNYWMYHVELVTQDLWEYDPKKLTVTGRKTLVHDGEQVEAYLLASEDDNLFKLWVTLLGENGDDQFTLSEDTPAYNSFVRKGGTVYLGKYDGRLELGPVVFNPESAVLRMFGGEGSLSYLHEKDFEDIRYAQRGERVSPNFPICQYKYLSDDLGDELHPEARAVFAKNMGLYEITSSSDALSGLILLGAVINGKEYLIQTREAKVEKGVNSRTDQTYSRSGTGSSSSRSSYYEEEEGPLDLDYRTYRVKIYDDTAIRIFLNGKSFYLQPDGRTSITFHDMGTSAKSKVGGLFGKSTEFLVEIEPGYRSATLTLTNLSDYSAFKLALSSKGWLYGGEGILFKPI